MRRYTQIKGLSQVRRLPRLGKIRLGVRVQKPGTDKTYPRETPHFVVPPEVAAVYGQEPTRLDVMLPVDDTAVTFPQCYATYGAGAGLKCSGDGVSAMRTAKFDAELRGDEKPQNGTRDLIEVPCPCELYEQGKCKQQGYLQVILPKISLGGVYQITTSSYNSIVDLNSSMDYVRALVGRLAMVPLILARDPRETHHDGKKQTHYTMRLDFAGDVATLNILLENTTRVLESCRALVLAPPEQQNPAEDEGGETVVEAEPAPESPATSCPPPALETPPQPAPAVPAPAKLDELLTRVGQATTIKQCNALLDQAQSLPHDLRKVAGKAVANRVKDIAGLASAPGA